MYCNNNRPYNISFQNTIDSQLNKKKLCLGTPRNLKLR